MNQIAQQVQISGGRAYTFARTPRGVAFIHMGGVNQDNVTTGHVAETRDPFIAAKWLRRLTE